MRLDSSLRNPVSTTHPHVRGCLRGPAPAILPLLLLSFASFALPATPVSAQDRVFRLDTLEVSVGSRVSPGLPVATRAVEVIDRERIRSTPARNVSELLRWATGVEFLPRSPAQADLSIRGGGFEQVLVLVDGVRVSDRQTGHFDLNVTVPLDRVERIEVLRGPGSALYGADAVGGVVNIVTRDGGRGWEGRIEGGSFETGMLSLGGGFGDAPIPGRPGGLAVHGGGEMARSDGHRPGTDYETALAHLRLAAPLADGGISGDFGFAKRGFGAEDFYGPYPAYETTRALTAAIGWRPTSANGLRIEPRLSLRRHDDDFILRRDDPEFYRNLHTTWQVGGEVTGRYSGGGGWSAAAGVEGYRDILESLNLGDRAETRGAVFAEGSLERGAVTASVGLRGDAHGTFGSFLSPTLSGAYLLSPELRVRASAGRAFRGPTWTERYYTDPANVGRDDLEVERSWSAELGADFAPAPGVRVSTTGFRRASRDLIDWARPVGTLDEDDIPWETRNVERATVHGVEWEVELVENVSAEARRGPRARVSFGGSLLDLSSDEAAGLESKYALRPLAQQLHIALLRPVTLRSDIAVRALRGKRADEDAFHQLDARLSVRLGSFGGMGEGTLYLDLTNVLDAGYADVIGRPVAGRAFMAGISLSGGE